MRLRIEHESLVGGDGGAALLELALLLPFLALLLVGAVDIGRVAYLAIEMQSAAQAGAVYGAQYPNDTRGVTAAVTAAAPDVQGVTVSVRNGCECSDGTQATDGCGSTPTCPFNVVYYVQVDAISTSYAMLGLPSLAQTFPLHSTVRMRAAF